LFSEYVRVMSPPSAENETLASPVDTEDPLRHQGLRALLPSQRTGKVGDENYDLASGYLDALYTEPSVAEISEMPRAPLVLATGESTYRDRAGEGAPSDGSCLIDPNPNRP